MSKIVDFNTDYTYMDSKTGDFKNVHIKLNVGENSFILELSAEEMLDKTIIQELLNQLVSNAFRKLRISLAEDCKIVLIAGGRRYKVSVADNGIVVNNISPED